MPKISVVIPTYQRATFLRQALDDLLRQSCPDIEIIVADDGSTDDTADVVRGCRDPRVRYLRRGRIGMPMILNEGFAEARGEFVMTCHDHDIYAPTMLAEFAKLLDTCPRVAYVHCGIVGVDTSGQVERARFVRNYPEVTPGVQFLADELLPGLHSPVPALSMVRRSSLNGGSLDPAYGGCADIELWLRLSTVGDVGYLRKALIRVRERDPASEFYHSGFRLAELALAAKKKYLEWVSDESKRLRIRNGWQRDVDRVGLVETHKALRAGRFEDCDKILEFVRREGTRSGRVTLAAVSSLPRSVTCWLLGCVRQASQGARRALMAARGRADEA